MRIETSRLHRLGTAAVMLAFAAAVGIGAAVAPDAIAQGRQSQVAGTYEGKVTRRYVKGAPRETRLYRVTFNPDRNTGKVLVYELEGEGKLRNELGFVVKETGSRKYEGETHPIQTVTGYNPDRIRMIFSRDGRTLDWFHSDGGTEGSGILTRQDRN